MAYYLTLLFNNLLVFLQDGGHEKPSLLSVSGAHNMDDNYFRASAHFTEKDSMDTSTECT